MSNASPHTYLVTLGTGTHVQTTAPDGRVDFYTAEIISSREYSAYGAELPGYSFSDGGNAASNAIFVRLEGRWIALGI